MLTNPQSGLGRVALCIGYPVWTQFRNCHFVSAAFEYLFTDEGKIGKQKTIAKDTFADI